MAHDTKVEDLYVKGMMAFSGKDYKSAYAYWKKVLELDPNHAETRKAVEKLRRLKQKKTPREVLKEIKELYAKREFERSLKLCTMLVKKFPDNKDLQGLLNKIKARVEATQSAPQPAPAPSEPSPQAYESTMYFQERAEASVSPDDAGEASTAEPMQPLSAPPMDDVSEEEQATGSSEVERLIQQGVTLYEIQDFEQALVVWEKALTIEPDNKVVLDYIAGVKKMDGANEGTSPATEEPNKPPSKEELVEIYNEGKELYKEYKYQDALDRWNRILEFHPNHKETLLCVKRAQKGLEEDAAHLKDYEAAEAAYSAGNYSEAERLVLPLVIKAPHLEGPQRLKEAIEERKKQITEIRNMEKEETLTESTAKASDDEITRYFTPTEPSAETGFSTSPGTPKMVVSAAEIQESRRSFRKRFIFGFLFLVVVAIAAAGFFAWKNWSEVRKKIVADAPVKVTIPRTIKWQSNEARVNDYLDIAEEYKALGDYFMAYCAYDRVEQLADAAVTELIEQKDTKDALAQIQAAKTLATSEKEKAKKKIVPEEVDKEAYEKALKGWTSEEAAEIIPVFHAALSQDASDLELREYLATAYGQLGFLKAKKLETLEEALDCFKKASILGPKGNRYRGHYKVIQLYYTNAIDDNARQQWFFLFSES